MSKHETHSGSARATRRLALAVGRGELDKWLAAQERRVVSFEESAELAPISMRRGRWLERTVPVWAAASRETFATGRRTFRLALWLGGRGERLRALEAREAAAFARLLARVGEERAKGWPRRTLYVGSRQ